MGRFENSFALAKASWRVLREDKQLTLLPLLSMVSTVVVAVSFLLPISLIARNGTDGYTASKPLVWVLGFCAYLVLTFVVVFFNAALVSAADRHLAAEPVSLGDAMK